MASDIANKKLAAGVCGILLGWLGVHKFILGYIKEGIIMLVVSLIFVRYTGKIMGVVGIIEGVIYLTRTEGEFVKTYIEGRRGWF